MIGNSHQPRQQSYEDANEIQAGINQFSVSQHTTSSVFLKFFEPFETFLRVFFY